MRCSLARARCSLNTSNSNLSRTTASRRASKLCLVYIAPDPTPGSATPQSPPLSRSRSSCCSIFGVNYCSNTKAHVQVKSVWIFCHRHLLWQLLTLFLLLLLEYWLSEAVLLEWFGAMSVVVSLFGDQQLTARSSGACLKQRVPCIQA